MMAVHGAEVEVRLQTMSLATAAGLLQGRRVVDGPPWHPAYPLAETLVGVGLLIDAHRAAGWDAQAVPAWWIHQVVADGVVVGDIGFHGPPSADGVVEIVGEPHHVVGVDGHLELARVESRDLVVPSERGAVGSVG